MSQIVYFISDHGFGHASRSIAIIRSLLECDLEISIEIHTSKPLSFVQRSFSQNEETQRVAFHEQMNDIGFIGDAITGMIDYQRTANEVISWIKDWHASYLFEEYHYLKSKNIDLIISDIAPQPFLLAKKLDLPSIAISNFTWFDIYQNPAFELRDLETIWKAYREASLGLMLPFNLNNTVFCSAMETNLVSRPPSRTKQQMREILRLDPDEEVVYLGTGLSLRTPFLEEWTKQDVFKFVLGGQHEVSHTNVRSVPLSDPEGQDYIACCDVALIKLGYSSVSEAIRAQVPIIGIDFPQTAETMHMKTVIEDLGIGVCFTSEEFFQGEWQKQISDVVDMKQAFSYLPDRFVKHGESQIAGIILDLLDEIC
ncbi:MAG: glycosyltransferase family protein [Candidatus Hodarchaeota archaeon]